MPNTRRNRSRKNRGLATALYSPFHHAFMAGEEAVNAVANTAKGVAKLGIRGVNRVGSSVTGHTDAAIKGVFSRKRRGGRRASRKNRRNSRKNMRKSRRNSRKNRRNNRK